MKKYLPTGAMDDVIAIWRKMREGEMKEKMKEIINKTLEPKDRLK